MSKGKRRTTNVTPYQTTAGERWRIRWEATAPDGKRRQRQRRGFLTKKEAQAALAKIVHEQQNLGRQTVHSTATVAERARAWLDLKEAQGKRATSLDNWRVSIETHIIPRLGWERVSALTPSTVERLYLDLARHGKRAGRCRTAGVTCADHGCSPERHAGLAPKTVRHVHGALRAVLSRAVEDGLLPSNPCDAQKVREALPQQASGTQRVRRDSYWSDDQARRFLVAAEEAEDPLLVAWTVLLGTGLRRGELLGLRWTDIDLTGGVLQVRRSITQVRGSTVETEGKTANTERTVPLGGRLVEVLRSHRTAQRAERLASGVPWSEDGPVIADAAGQTLKPDRVSRAFAASAAAAGLPAIGVHGLRHTAATAMLRRGVPIPTVARVLGHSNPSVTLTVYAHAVPADDELVAVALDRAVFGETAAV